MEVCGGKGVLDPMMVSFWGPAFVAQIEEQFFGEPVVADVVEQLAGEPAVADVEFKPVQVAQVDMHASAVGGEVVVDFVDCVGGGVVGPSGGFEQKHKEAKQLRASAVGGEGVVAFVERAGVGFVFEPTHKENRQLVEASDNGEPSVGRGQFADSVAVAPVDKVVQLIGGGAAASVMAHQVADDGKSGKSRQQGGTAGGASVGSGGGEMKGKSVGLVGSVSSAVSKKGGGWGAMPKKGKQVKDGVGEAFVEKSVLEAGGVDLGIGVGAVLKGNFGGGRR